MWTGTTISGQIAPSPSGTTYRQDSDHDRLEDMGLLGQTTNVAVVDLVNPQRGRRANKEQRELNRDGEHQDRVVDTVDRARRANTLESLPAERLKDRSEYKANVGSARRTFISLQLRKRETSNAKPLRAMLGISAFDRAFQ